MKASGSNRILTALLGTILLACVSGGAQDRIPIERLQREFQARHHYIAEDLPALQLPPFVQWPSCGEDAAATPHFPKDHYYGDFDDNPEKAVELLQDLKTKFFATTTLPPDPPKWNFADRFVKEDMVEGNADVPCYALSDFDQSAFDNIDIYNYTEKFALLESYLRKLIYVRIDRETVVARTLLVEKATRQGYGIRDTCNAAKQDATAAWLTAGWSSTGSDDIFAQAATWHMDLDPQPPQYWAILGANRARTYTDLRRLRGTGKLYLRLHTLGTPYSSPPPVAADQTWHLAPAGNNISGEQEFYYPALGQDPLGSVQPVFTAGNTCPLFPDDDLTGWYGGGSGGLWHLIVFKVDFDTEPDPDCCGACNDCEPGQVSIGLQSIHINIPLGPDNYGGSAGSVVLSANLPSPSLTTLAALRYSVASTVDVVPDSSPVNRLQFKTSQSLTDIQVNNAYKYTLSVYSVGNFGPPDGQGFYPPTGPASTTIVVENPDASATIYNRLRVTHTKSGNSTVSEYVYTAANAEWELSTGNGLRREYRSSVWDVTQTLRTETVTVKNNAQPPQIVYKERNVYRRYPWGEERVQQVVDPDTAALTSTWDFYSNPADGGNYGRLRETLNARGHWIRYEYDAFGREAKRVTQFRDEPVGSAENLNRVVSTTYSQTAPQTTVIEKLKDKIIGRRYQIVTPGQVQDIVCQRHDANVGDPDNLRTTTKRYTTEPNKGELLSVENPDGTMQFYTYLVAGTRTETVDSGQPNPGKTAIIDGTKTVTVKGAVGQLISRTVTDIVSPTVTLSKETYSNYDQFNRPQRVTYLDGTSSDTVYGCCGVTTTTDRDGVVTTYLYDSLKRQDGYVRHLITTRNILDSEGRILVTTRTGTDTSQIVLYQAAYDVAGRLMVETNGLNGRTTYVETFNASGQLVKTITYPDMGQRIERYHKDGSLAEVSGSAAYPLRYVYDVEPMDGTDRSFTKEIKVAIGGGENEWTKNYTDFAGRVYKTVYADTTTGTETDNPFSRRFYKDNGQLWKERDPDAVLTVFIYNGRGEIEYTMIGQKTEPTTPPTAPDTSGEHPITQVRTQVDSYTDGTSHDTLRTRNTEWTTLGNNNQIVSSDIHTSIKPYQTGPKEVRQWVVTYPNETFKQVTRTVTVYGSLGTRTVTVTYPDTSYQISVFSYGRPASVTRYPSSGGPISQVTYQYDKHGRLWKSIDARNGTTIYEYNNADQVITVTGPPPANGQSAQTRTTLYDSSIRPIQVTEPDGIVYTRYYPNGLPKLGWGTRTYPNGYEYDAQGRVRKLYTWQSFTAPNPADSNPPFPSGSVVTIWTYDPHRGWLQNKRDADSTGADYDYTRGGRLRTRSWGRSLPGSPGTRLTATYSYDFDPPPAANNNRKVGYVAKIEYNDSGEEISTPALTFDYDRRGRPRTVTQMTVPAITTTLAWHAAGKLDSETYAGSFLNTLSVVSDNVDPANRLRRESLEARKSGIAIAGTTVTYGYDNASRLASLTSGGFSVNYGYVANSDLIETITSKQLSPLANRLTTTRQFDFVNRLRSIAPAPSAASQPSLSCGYVYNSAGQRVLRTQGDASSWRYEYDGKGQIIAAKHLSPHGEVVPGQQFEYGYDDIGNRVLVREGGDQDGGGLRQTTYVANNVNEYGSRSINPADRKIDVMGLALVANGTPTTVTVNEAAPDYRRGEYFWKQLAVGGAGPNWFEVRVVAGPSSRIGNLYVPPQNETFVYDDDGNLISDARWLYKWDGENRLIRMETQPSAAAPAVGVPAKRIQFTYDYQGRLSRRQVFSGTYNPGPPPTITWSGTAEADLIFAYDGFQCIAALKPDHTLHQAYVWGLDVSETFFDAGGVGGLAMFRRTVGENLETYFPAYDGNGNVTALVKGSDGTVSARYEYGPFGHLLRVSGQPVALENPFRFSTKYQDDHSELLYYGYRFYSPTMAKWLNRDPIEEFGGLNLYGFVRNNPSDYVDLLGLQEAVPSPEPVTPIRVLPSPGSVPNNIIRFPRPGPSFSGALAGPAAVGLALMNFDKGWVMEGMYINWFDKNGLPRPTQYPYGQKRIDMLVNQGELGGAPLEEIRENARMMEELLLADKVVTHHEQTGDSKTCCKFMWSKFQLGGWPEHDNYAAHVFKVRSELIVVARDGDTARYDGGFTFPSPVNVAGEVKTGRRWSPRPSTGWSSIQRNIYQRDMIQFQRQERVAKKCDLIYKIYLKERPGFDGYSRNALTFAQYMVHYP